jgi:hypothetical protein
MSELKPSHIFFLIDLTENFVTPSCCYTNELKEAGTEAKSLISSDSGGSNWRRDRSSKITQKKRPRIKP